MFANIFLSFETLLINQLLWLRTVSVHFENVLFHLEKYGVKGIDITVVPVPSNSLLIGSRRKYS